MLPSTLKYLYSVEPVRMHFPAKQPCTNDTVCNAVMHGEKVGYCYSSGLEKTFCKWGKKYVLLVTKGLSEKSLNNCARWSALRSWKRGRLGLHYLTRFWM
jgi:hypothetical protein